MTDHEARVRRLADRIQEIVAQLLERRIKDPRLGFVTITDVRLTNDMREASVFYTVMGDDQEQADSAAALQSARGMIRTEVGRITGVRFAPSIKFVQDALPTTVAHIEELLDQAAKDDARVHEQAASADFAGEADPYRDDSEPDEDTEPAGQ